MGLVLPMMVCMCVRWCLCCDVMAVVLCSVCVMQCSVVIVLATHCAWYGVAMWRCSYAVLCYVCYAFGCVATEDNESEPEGGRRRQLHTTSSGGGSPRRLPEREVLSERDVLSF